MNDKMIIEVEANIMRLIGQYARGVADGRVPSKFPINVKALSKSKKKTMEELRCKCDEYIVKFNNIGIDVNFDLMDKFLKEYITIMVDPKVKYESKVFKYIREIYSVEYIILNFSRSKEILRDIDLEKTFPHFFDSSIDFKEFTF